MIRADLQRGNEITSLLDVELTCLSSLDSYKNELGYIGQSLLDLIRKDSIFKKAFHDLISQTKERLSCEFTSL